MGLLKFLKPSTCHGLETPATYHGKSQVEGVGRAFPKISLRVTVNQCSL